MLIMLDAGHGGNDPGASGFGLREKDWALDMVKRVGKHLANYNGVSVAYTRTTDVYVGINERCQIANSKGADLFLSFHNNAGGGKGYESYVAATASSTSKKLQEKVTADILSFLKAYNIGAHGDATKLDTQSARGSLGVLRNTKMPAVLFENLFIDNPYECNLLKTEDFKEKLAKAYAKSIAEFYGLQPKVVSKPTIAEVEDMYDMSYLVGDSLKGLQSSRHPEELLPKLKWAMEAHAQCVLVLRRDFDLRHLQNALNKMFPDNK